MHVEAGAMLALAVIGHAWVTRIGSADKGVNAAGWAVGLLVTFVLLFTGLVTR